MSATATLFPTANLPTKPLTDHDLARLFGVSLLTVRRWAAAGELPEPVVLGSRRYWSAEVIEKFLARNPNANAAVAATGN